MHKGVLNRNVEIAVKQLKPNSMSIEDFLREAETMKDVRHDKVSINSNIKLDFSNKPDVFCRLSHCSEFALIKMKRNQF